MPGINTLSTCMPNKTVIAVSVNSVKRGRAASHSINIINLSLFAVALTLRGIQFPFADLAFYYTGRSLYVRYILNLLPRCTIIRLQKLAVKVHVQYISKAMSVILKMPCPSRMRILRSWYSRGRIRTYGRTADARVLCVTWAGSHLRSYCTAGFIIFRGITIP